MHSTPYCVDGRLGRLSWQSCGEPGRGVDVPDQVDGEGELARCHYKMKSNDDDDV